MAHAYHVVLLGFFHTKGGRGGANAETPLERKSESVSSEIIAFLYNSWIMQIWIMHEKAGQILEFYTPIDFNLGSWHCIPVFFYLLCPYRKDKQA